MTTRNPPDMPDRCETPNTIETPAAPTPLDTPSAPRPARAGFAGAHTAPNAPSHPGARNARNAPDTPAASNAPDVRRAPRDTDTPNAPSAPNASRAPETAPEASLGPVDFGFILRWLREEDPAKLEALWAAADATRLRHVGNAVHLRGLVEISNHCVRHCAYCGMRAPNTGIERYRMTADEILACAREARGYGFCTVVLQAGEDHGLTTERVEALIRRIKTETGLAVTLSLGERLEHELAAWRRAGADRYLLRFETSDPDLYRLIHPVLPGGPIDRLAHLRTLAGLGYEAGGGVMVGIPGQSYDILARDILTFREMDLDMIGTGPYLPHPATPLARGEIQATLAPENQVPNSELMACKVIALARLACPEANIPATTALATVNAEEGYERGLTRGANIVMPNLTPPRYRALYEIYPNKASLAVNASVGRLMERIRAIGRSIGSGPGGRRRG